MVGELLTRAVVGVAVTSLGAGRVVLAAVAHVTHRRVLHERREHHEEAHDEEHVDGLEVGDLGQRGVGAGDEGGHGEHRGDTEGSTGRNRFSVSKRKD